MRARSTSPPRRPNLLRRPIQRIRHRRLRSTLPRPTHENIVHQPELPHRQDDQPVDVDLVPGVREVGVAREAVVVVVQAFAEGEQRRDEFVGGAVRGCEAAVAVAAAAVADRVDQRGRHGHEVAAEQTCEQHATDHRMHAAERVADDGGNDHRRERVPVPARPREEHRDRVGQDIPGVKFAVGRGTVPHPAALRVHHALGEAGMGMTFAVIIRAVDVAGLVGMGMVAAVVGNPFQHRALHRHGGDRGEDRPHHRTAAKTAVDEIAVHEADADRRHHERAGEGPDLDPADALPERPDQRRDRASDHEAERDVGIEELGVDDRAFDQHALHRRHLRRSSLLRQHALDYGHFNSPVY